MSALRIPESPRTSAETRPRLRPASSPQTPRPLGSVAFASIILAILGIGMFGLLVLQSQVQVQGKELSELGSVVDSLREREAALRTQLEAVSSPSELMRRASAMKMVPVGQPGYLMLGTGKVTGSPKPATGRDLARLQTRDQQIAEAKAKADADAKAKAEAEAKAKAEAEARARAEQEAQAQASAPPSARPTPGAQASPAAQPTTAPTGTPVAAAPTGKPTAQPAATTTTPIAPKPTKRGP